MRLKLSTALCLALAACGGPAPSPSTPLTRCEAQADDDPTVRQMRAIAAGTPEWLWQNQDKLIAARNTAISRCLQVQGGGAQLYRGGVERPR